jgi:hypothetical protein
VPITKTGRTRIIAFLVGLGFAILFAEIAGRFLGLLPVRSSESYIKLTREVGHLPAPFSNSRFSEPGEFDTKLHFNAMGFRDQNIDFPNSNGKKILAVGDSFVTAWEVEVDQRWTEQMHRFRSDWNILNVGMRNWGTDQTYLNLVHYPIRKQPDIVLLMFFVGNDVSDNYRPGILKSPWDAPHFLPKTSRVSSFSELQKVPWSGYKDPFDEPEKFSFPRNINSWLRLHSVVYRAIDLTRQFIQERAGNRFRKSSKPDNSDQPRLTWGVFNTADDPPEWRTAWEITEILLREMKSVCEKRNTQFMIVISPYAPLIEPNEQAKRKGLLDQSKYDLEKPAKRLIQFGKDNQIPVLDLAPGLMEYRQSNSSERLLFFPIDGHFTPLGNCVVASLIVNWIDPQSNADVKQCSGIQH